MRSLWAFWFGVSGCFYYYLQVWDTEGGCTSCAPESSTGGVGVGVWAVEWATDGGGGGGGGADEGLMTELVAGGRVCRCNTRTSQPPYPVPMT